MNKDYRNKKINTEIFFLANLRRIRKEIEMKEKSLYSESKVMEEYYADSISGDLMGDEK